MATKGSTDASDEVFDYVCSPCNKKDKNSEAVRYCIDCQEYLCVACIEHHNSFSVLAGHTLVGRSKFGNASGADRKDLPSVPTERCKVHTLKIIDMYCADHNSVGCHICFTINHKPCHGIHYIPEYVRTTRQTENVRKIKEEMEKTISEIDHVLKSKQRDIEDNRKAKATELEEIKEFRTEINETLDRLEQASVAEVEEKYGKLDQDFRDELKNVQDTLYRLTACKTEMESSQKNQSQQFVNIRMSENVISEAQKVGTRTKDVLEDNITFALERNSKILLFLQNLDSLVKRESSRKNGLYQVQNKSSYNVKLNTDNIDINIWSSCMLDSGDILLADYINSNIKLVDCESYNVRNSMKLSASPQSVFKISNVEAAVSFGNKTVQFLSTNNALVPTRSLKFDHDCRGIAVVDGKLVICEEGNKAYIYTMSGNCLNIIRKDPSGNDIFRHIREICVSDCCKTIIVVDDGRGPVAIDRDGNVVWRYSGQELKSAWGVCTDGNGNVFISGESSKNVIQIGPDGKLLGEVVSKAHGLHCPKAVSFDRKRCKLIVSDDNELHVFHVQ